MERQKNIKRAVKFKYVGYFSSKTWNCDFCACLSKIVVNHGVSGNKGML